MAQKFKCDCSNFALSKKNRQSLFMFWTSKVELTSIWRILFSRIFLNFSSTFSQLRFSVKNFKVTQFFHDFFLAVIKCDFINLFFTAVNFHEFFLEPRIWIFAPKINIWNWQFLRISYEIFLRIFHHSDTSYMIIILTMFENDSKCRIWIFRLLEFSINFCHIKSNLSSNTVWPQKWTIFGFLMNFCPLKR